MKNTIKDQAPRTHLYFPLFIVVLTFFYFENAAAQSYVPEENNVAVNVKPTVVIKAYAFPFSVWSLFGFLFRHANDVDVKYLVLIEPDICLSKFRIHAGLKYKAQKYGGLESEGLAGHTLGHYLSVRAMEYAVSKNPEFLKR